MGQYRKKPIVIEATQWFKNGDHPEDYAQAREGYADGNAVTFSPEYCREHQWEGAVVKYYLRPDDIGSRICEHCGKTMREHGWLDTHLVCPGDWIITGIEGERYACKSSVFEATYEPKA